VDTSHLRRVLDDTDWNFIAARTSERTVHSLHWFPGNFIPQIPAFLIQLLSRPTDLVLDPFCGTGTTGIEAVRLGRRSIVSDVSRAALQVAAGKIAAAANPNLHRELIGIGHQFFFSIRSRDVAGGRRGEGTHPELARWYDPDTLSELRSLWRAIEKTSGPLRDILELIFTDTLFACASTSGGRTASGRERRHHWGWIADNVIPKTPFPHEACGIFRKRLERAAEIMLLHGHDHSVPATVVQQDARALAIPDCSVDLVVTSPPYLQMIDYTLANRLTYLWMGWPIDRERQREIGARYRRKRRTSKSEYLDSFKRASENFFRVVRPGGLLAVVLGGSRRVPGISEDALALLGEDFETIWGPRSRTPSKRRVAERRGREAVEWICVYRRPQ